jgi:hypothetical protein
MDLPYHGRWDYRRENAHATASDVNTENIQKLIDHLKSIDPCQFDMSRWYGPVYDTTPTCIGGWTDRLFDIDSFDDMDTFETLGLDSSLGHLLCYPDDHAAHKATLAQGIQVLEILRDTGRVCWNLVMRHEGDAMRSLADTADA